MKKAAILVAVIILMSTLVFSQEQSSQLYRFSYEFDQDRILSLVVPAPQGYDRLPVSRLNLFMKWITNLPLKRADFPVARWDRQILMSADSINGIIDIAVATDNQKDADIPLQLMIEYLLARNELYDFPIIIGNGDTLTYRKWLNNDFATDARGNLITKESEEKEDTETQYYRFLEFVMVHNDAHSLLYNLEKVGPEDILPGDLFIQFRADDVDTTDHTAMILDVSSNSEGELMLLAAWGGIPARSFAVARPLPISDDQWFTIEELKKRLAEYGDGEFYRFKNLNDS